jgi:hypothetical protein
MLNRGHDETIGSQLKILLDRKEWRDYPTSLNFGNPRILNFASQFPSRPTRSGLAIQAPAMSQF